MLISEKMNVIIRTLLVNTFEAKPNLTLPDLAKEAKITHSMAKRIALRLEKSEYIKIGQRIKVIQPTKLMKAWGYTYSIRELERLEFVLAERPQYAIIKISNWARIEKIPYAFTLFSATEQVSPYVAPSNTYVYILKKDISRWEKFFREQKILPAEKGGGNLICLLTDENYLKGKLNMRGVNIVSLPQLYADLMSFGGRGEEAAQELEKTMSHMKEIRNEEG